MSNNQTLHENLELDDVLWSASRLPEVLAVALQQMKEVAFVGGGHVRGCIAREEPSDVDVFTQSAAGTAELQGLLGKSLDKPFQTEFALTFSGSHRPIQLITKWHFTNLDDLLDHFDFTVSRAGISWGGKGWWGRCDHRFYRDLASRRLRLATSPGREALEAGGTLLRLVKYARKGYIATPETVARVAFEAARPAVLASDSVDELVMSLRGIDPGYWPAWVRDQVEKGGSP